MSSWQEVSETACALQLHILIRDRHVFDFGDFLSPVLVQDIIPAQSLPHLQLPTWQATAESWGCGEPLLSITIPTKNIIISCGQATASVASGVCSTRRSQGSVQRVVVLSIRRRGKLLTVLTCLTEAGKRRRKKVIRYCLYSAH